MNSNKNNNFLGDIFQAIADILNGAERSFLDLLSVIVPYTTPLPAAYLTFTHTIDMLDFPRWIAWTSAFAVEALGLASVSTAIRFYRNNRAYKSDKERAPFWLAISVYAAYLVIVLTLNVVLEVVSGSRSGWVILAIALFTLLSVPSGVLISIRSLYTEMLIDRQERKAERQETRRPRWQPRTAPQPLNSDTEQEALSDGKPFRDNGA